MSHLLTDDPQVAGIIKKEEYRISNTINLIAAENSIPASIMEAQGSIFTIKAAEGYPGKRFHAGCQNVDALETLAVLRAKTLFGADHANVQPHSGVAANLAVYFAALNIGDIVLSMELSHGGHLSHGALPSITSRCFNFKHYRVRPENEMIDYDQISNFAKKYQPKMIVAGASSYSRLIDFQKISAIAKDNSAYLMVDMAHIAGLVAAKVIPSPVPFSDFVTFTTYKTMMGGRGGVILCKEKYGKKIDKTIFPGGQGTPSINSIAAKAVCFKTATQQKFIHIQEKTIQNARFFAESFLKRGYRIVSGGTDNHMVLIDLKSKKITGDTAEKVLESVGIIVNRNPIPFDTRRPDISSGIRIGTASISARGMGVTEVKKISEYVDTAIMNRGKKEVLNKISEKVYELSKNFPQ